MAKLTHTPLGYLFLPEPPDELADLNHLSAAMACGRLSCSIVRALTRVDEDGMVVLRARPTPEVGAVVLRALEAALEQVPVAAEDGSDAARHRRHLDHVVQRTIPATQVRLARLPTWYMLGPMASPILKGERFSAEETARICERLSRDGYCTLGPVLEPEEVAALRAAMERKLADPAMQEGQPGDHRRGFSLMRMFEYDQTFRDLIVREPFASLAEAVLGDDCHCMSQNALFTKPKPDAVADGPGGWHVDDLVQFPLPPEVPRHDPRVPLPTLALQLFTPLTSIEAVEFGPTQVVPGSHYAGRRPAVQDRPHFAGNGPVSMLARPGDAYLFNNQVWHRGAPNVSQRRRLLGGVTYSRRYVAQRFYPFIDYRMPEHVWEGAGPRLQRMLGRHRKGPYG